MLLMLTRLLTLFDLLFSSFKSQYLLVWQTLITGSQVYYACSKTNRMNFKFLFKKILL
jgi:hypothetical protein